MKWVFRILLLIILGYGAYRFWVYASTPASSRSKETDLRQVLGGRAPREAPNVPQGNIKYAGVYITFEYPARAMVLPQTEKQPAILEKIDLEMKDPRLSIIAAVTNSTEKRLEDVPGVNLRRMQSDTYHEDQVTIGPGKTPVFSRIDGTEKTLFIMREGRLYTLSVIGNNQDELKSLWNQVLPTFHFK